LREVLSQADWSRIEIKIRIKIKNWRRLAQRRGRLATRQRLAFISKRGRVPAGASLMGTRRLKEACRLV
jgi:hypothetical protein